MMLKISDQHQRIATLVVHSLLIFIGVIVIGLGLVLHESQNMELNPDTDTDNDNFQISVLVGCLDILIGVCGLAAALTKQRALQIMKATILALAMIFNLLFLTACIFKVTVRNSMTSAIEGRKATFAAEYGNLTDPECRETTNYINIYHETNSCCGWTGLDGDNVYLNSPWHKLVNQNVTGKSITLPESCCVRPDDTECTTAGNVKEAREKGLVYKKDCLTSILSALNAPYKAFILQIVLSVVLQIPSAALAVMFLLPAH